MKFDTKSEEIFAKICEGIGISSKKITSLSVKNKQSADFELITPFGRIIAEVKELCSNKDDKRQEKELKEQRFTSGGSKIATRAREAIREASKQLRTYEEDIPKVVILYNNISTGYPMMHLQPHDIGSALYGDLVVTVSLNHQESDAMDKSGGNRTVTDSIRKYLSAVIVISDEDNESLHIYHNKFATISLYDQLFIKNKHYHYRMNEQKNDSPWNWETHHG